MKTKPHIIILACMATMCLPVPAFSAGVSVSPVLVEVAEPERAAVVSVSGGGGNIVQARVMKWMQVNGEDKLEPAKDVVASPPSFRLGADGDYVVRVVRLSDAPVAGEEAFRLFVDQLPAPRLISSKQVSFVVRQSIPVFFEGAAGSRAPLRWSVRREGKEIYIQSHNDGAVRWRLSDLRLRDTSGREHVVSGGLAGYILGQSTFRWKLTKLPPGFNLNKPVEVFANSDAGKVHAVAE